MLQGTSAAQEQILTCLVPSSFRNNHKTYSTAIVILRDSHETTKPIQTM